MFLSSDHLLLSPRSVRINSIPETETVSHKKKTRSEKLGRQANLKLIFELSRLDMHIPSYYYLCPLISLELEPSFFKGCAASAPLSSAYCGIQNPDCGGDYCCSSIKC